MLFYETSDFLRCSAKSIRVMCFSPLTGLFLIKHNIFCFFLYYYASNDQLIFCFGKQELLLSLPLDWLANLISSSISIGSLNKYQLAEMLLAACSYYQLWSTSIHVQKYSTCQKNVARMQVKHLLNVNSLEIIWSSFLFLTLNKFLRKEETCFSYKIFILLVLAYSFLQVTRCNFIGK